MPERRPRADRAQQFMPFAALKGYYDLIRERERVAEPKRELTDEQALELSRKLSQLKRRELACIVPSTTSRTSGRTRDASAPEKHARRPFCVFFGR